VLSQAWTTHRATLSWAARSSHVPVARLILAAYSRYTRGPQESWPSISTYLTALVTILRAHVSHVQRKQQTLSHARVCLIYCLICTLQRHIQRLFAVYNELMSYINDPSILELPAWFWWLTLVLDYSLSLSWNPAFTIPLVIQTQEAVVQILQSTNFGFGIHIFLFKEPDAN
jgi:hypothetical protein